MDKVKKVIKSNINKSYDELKHLIDDINVWIDKTKETDLTWKVKEDYEKLKDRTEDVLNRITDLRTQLKDSINIKDTLNDKSKSIKMELDRLQDELKILVAKMSSWIVKAKNVDILSKVKTEYQSAKVQSQKIMDKIYKMKIDLIDDDYIEVTYNWSLVPVVFNKKSKCLEIADEKYKLHDIQIWEDIKSSDIKVVNLTIKKDKPILSIVMPSQTAKKFKLAKNTSKPFALEWVLKREKIAEVAKWLLIYGKGEFKLKMNNLDVRVGVDKK